MVDATTTEAQQKGPNDPELIRLREPREAWIAPILWGAMFGGLLLVPALLSDDGSGWERIASLIAGMLGSVFFAGMAVQNRFRELRCDSTGIALAQPFFARRIELAAVHAVVRRDLRKKLRELRQRGMSRLKPKPFDTMAEVVVYSLRDRAGQELLMLNRELEPRAELRRLLARLEAQTGKGIADE